MTTKGLLNHLASQGQGGDTELAYVNPQEAQLLKSLGGSGTINPKTGLRQYDWRWTDPLNLHHNNTLSDFTGGNTALDSIVTGVSDVWDKSFGVNGLAAIVNNLLNWDSTDMDMDLFGLGDTWTNWIANPISTGHIGLPGEDAAWEAAEQSYSPMQESIGELEALRQQIIDSYTTGTDIFDKGTNLYNQGTDAYFKGMGLLGQTNRNALAPNIRAYENVLGKSGSKFGVSAGPIDPRAAGHDDYLTSIFGARGNERDRRRGELNRQSGESTRQQNYLDDMWGVLATARDRYNNWYSDITNADYRRDEAPTFEQTVSGFDWLTPPGSTGWQPNYPTTVPG